ncbi:MAG: ABC transporter permease subunit [Alphaproteobacteria bacterium]|nr:ABC transporter permease subunit [Alphaproteobacteria bacterium]
MTGPAAAPAPALRGRRTERVAGFAYLAVAPTLLVVLLVVGVPLGYSFFLSLNRTNPITKRWIFVGLQNYTALLHSTDLLQALGRTAYFAAFSVIGTTLLGGVFALVLNERFAGRGVLRSIVLVPWAMAPISVGVLWSFLFAGEFGAINGLLNDLGLSALATPWLGNGFRALNLLALVHVWNQAPLTALMLLAGLQSMPASLHKAAMLDGAGPVRRFLSITLPWLKPNLMFISIIATINALMAFDVLWALTRGGPGNATTVLAWLGYLMSFQFFKFGEGAAVLYVLTAISFVLAIFYFVVLGPRRGGAPAPAGTLAGLPGARRVRSMAVLPPFRPRRGWLPPATARAAARIGFWGVTALVLIWSAWPVVALLLMSLMPGADLIRTPATFLPSTLTLHNFIAVLMPDTVAAVNTSVQAQRVPFSLLNSFIVGAVVAVVSVALGTLAGYAFSRNAKARTFQAALWGLLLTRMTPALTLVLPYFIGFRVLGLIDTRLALIISYCSFLLPLSAWMMRSYFEGVPLSLDRAALIDGCSRAKMLWKILLPVARPGVVATAIFCFLASWNEFLFALILTSTPKAQTIPVILAGFLSQAQFYTYGPLFAATVLSIAPPVAVAFLFQRYLVQGALSGAVKG